MTGWPRQAFEAFTNLPESTHSPSITSHLSLSSCLPLVHKLQAVRVVDGSQMGGMLLLPGLEAGPGGQQQWVGGQVNKINPS